MTERDDRWARLQKRCDKHQNQWGGASGVLVVLDDLRAELKASNRDRKALEELRGHLSKTVALAERDRRNLLGLNDAVKGPGGGRAQLREWIAAHPEAYSLSSKGLMADLLIDIDSAERDRKALADARELLGNIPDSVVQIKHLYPRWHRAIVAFLKRTEPTDD